MSRFVLDASVVLTWCFPDENTALAEHVAYRLAQGDTALAPSFWSHEVLNALLAGEKRKRISKQMIRNFLDDLVALPVALEQSPSKIVFDRIQSLSREHGLTAYDAAYLDLAIESRLALATLDEALVRASRDAGVALVSL
ncbi:MAG TPA: type II toxin-antitoxin system VapC family toxin [Terriglobales bacterium]|nr:type II toxin-antitoxin system VapC family toxin [Terriglobales bacterium]